MIRITSLPKWAGELTVQPVSWNGRDMPLQPLTLLIIEDDPTTRLALACMIADTHYQVILASSAEDALERLPVIDPDIILCDFLLDGMSGREFCERLKVSARWRYIPIIAVTRMDDVSIVTDLLRSGADDVLVKPVRAEELRARVQAGLRRRENYLQLGGQLGGYGTAAGPPAVVSVPQGRLDVCA